MKAKVLRYKFDGNTIVAPYMELEPYAENVFISLARKNEYGNESEDSFHVICKIGDVHFSCGQYSRRILDKEGHREEAAAYCKNWIENILKDAEDGKIIPLLSVHVFNALGLDSTPLVQARETYAKRQEEKRLERKRKEEQEKKEKESRWHQQLDENKRKFLNGEKITAEMFLEITGRDGFDIHIRTKGTFNRHVTAIDRNGTVSFRKYKGRRTPDFTGCHKAVTDYLAFLAEDEISQ